MDCRGHRNSRRATEANSARAISWQDLVLAHMLTEDEARAAARVRDQDVKVAAAGAAIDSLPIPAGCVAQIDDVVDVAGASQVESSDGIGCELYFPAALGFAFVARLLEHFLHARGIDFGIERLGILLGVLCGSAAANNDGAGDATRE